LNYLEKGHNVFNEKGTRTWLTMIWFERWVSHDWDSWLAVDIDSLKLGVENLEELR